MERHGVIGGDGHCGDGFCEMSDELNYSRGGRLGVDRNEPWEEPCSGWS
jgi:hypothetical protein